jgi:drug/metabolite transporter (DMT)-like permease
MFYLVLAILCSCAIGVIIKVSEINKIDRIVVLAVNYVIASAIAWYYAFYDGGVSGSVTTFILGITGGLLWPTTFFMFMWGIHHFGIAITGPIARLGLVVPVVIALLFLGEHPTYYILTGIIAAFVAFFLISPLDLGDLRRSDKSALWFFPLLVLMAGVTGFWANFFNVVAPKEEKSLFMALIFTISGVIVWAVIIFRRIALSWKAVLSGIVMGVPNYYSTFFLLESLKAPLFIGLSMVVYTVYSTACLVIDFSAGSFVFKEKVTVINLIGIVVAAVAIALLNM